MTATTQISRGTLYTLSYADPGAVARVAHLMTNERTLLIDIRSVWFPTWNPRLLEQRYASRYRRELRLRNVNYQDHRRGIQLAEGHMEAVHEVASHVRQGTNLILLCTC